MGLHTARHNTLGLPTRNPEEPFISTPLLSKTGITPRRKDRKDNVLAMVSRLIVWDYLIVPETCSVVHRSRRARLGVRPIMMPT